MTLAKKSQRSLWEIFSSGVNPSQLLLTAGVHDNAHCVHGIFTEPLYLHQVKAERESYQSNVNNELTNIVFTNDINYAELNNKAHKLRKKNKAFSHRKKITVEHFQYQTPIDKVMHALKKSLDKPALENLQHEIYIPIRSVRNKLFIRLILSADLSIQCAQIITDNNSLFDKDKIDVERLRVQLAESLALNFDFPVKKIKRITIRELPGVYTTNGFWTAFTATENDADNSLRKKGVNRKALSAQCHDIDYQKHVLPSLYVKVLEKIAAEPQSNDDPRKMSWKKHIPKAYLKIRYQRAEDRWDLLKRSGLKTIGKGIVAFFISLRNELTTRGQAVQVQEDAKREKSNASALPKSSNAKLVLGGIALGLLAFVLIVAIIESGGLLAFLVLGPKLFIALSSAVEILVMDFVTLSFAYSNVLLYTLIGGLTTAKLALPTLGKLIKYPFTRRFEKKANFTLQWRELMRLHAWQRSKDYTPNEPGKAYYLNDMQADFVNTKAAFNPLFTYIHGQYQRFTQFGIPRARYIEEAAYWARLRRKVKEAKVNEVMQVLEFHLNKREEYCEQMYHAWAKGYAEADRLLAIFDRLFVEYSRDMAGDFTAIESLLQRCMKEGRKIALQSDLLTKQMKYQEMSFGSQKPLYSAKEKLQHFVDWWGEAKRLELLDFCLRQVDERIVKPANPKGSLRSEIRAKLKLDVAGRGSSARAQQGLSINSEVQASAERGPLLRRMQSSLRWSMQGASQVREKSPSSSDMESVVAPSIYLSYS